jgi:hypothetical protein
VSVIAIPRDEFLEMLTRADMTYAQLGRKINRHERTVSNWGGKNGGVPARYAAVVRDALAPAGTPGNPLAAYSDYALLDELARRLRRSQQPDNADEQWVNADPETTA